MNIERGVLFGERLIGGGRVMCASVFNAYVKLLNRKLEFYLFSDELPPLFSTKRKAEDVFNALSRVFGHIYDEGSKTVIVKPPYVPAVLTWTIVSLTLGPHIEMLEKLIDGTPTTALELILESIDAGRAYEEKKPLIPEQRLARVSRRVSRILGLINEDRVYHSGVL